MNPDPSLLRERIDLDTPIVGVHDAPDPAPFEPLLRPKADKRRCMFECYPDWIEGKTLHLTAKDFGCGGARRWLFGVEGGSRESFLEFLVEGEGLKGSKEQMGRWVDAQRPYVPEHGNIFIGPVGEERAEWLKSVTFFVNPDQLSALIVGAWYDHEPGEPPAVLAPFGSGCMELFPLFEDPSVPQAIIGATDLAMRADLPPDRLAFTVTMPMFERLCSLGEKSFLYKPFWTDLRKARGPASL